MKQNYGKMNLSWKQVSRSGLLALYLLLFSLACTDEGQWEKGSGFDYRLFPDKPKAERISTGDSIWVHYGIYKENRLLHHSREDGSPYRFMLPPVYERTFLDQPLAFMAEGDSLWMRIRYDSVRSNLGNYGDLFSKGDWVYFGLKVVQVNSRVERKAQRELQYAKNRGFSTVEAMRVSVKQAQERSDSLKSYMQAQLAAYQAETLSIDSLPNGLRFHLVEKGKGPVAGRDSLERVFVHYMAALQSSGTIYDNSFQRGDRLVFEQKEQRFIEGLRKALLAFPIGTKALIFIPAKWAYGTAGSPPFVPPNADLAFYIEWVDYSPTEE